MSPALTNSVRQFRQQRGWSQDELAHKAGLSRAGVSAIEIGRLTPSALAALALAQAFACRVEDLFHLSAGAAMETAWAWTPARETARYWLAEVGGSTWRYPVEHAASGVAAHDGVCREGECAECEHAGGVGGLAAATIVLASCDPAVNLLAREIESSSPYRVLVFSRSSIAALELLGRGAVHAAGVHLPNQASKRAASYRAGRGNAGAVRAAIGGGFALLRVADWDEGIAVAPGRRLRSPAAALDAKLTWIGREAGSGARQCLDQLRGERRAPARVAASHRGVAEAIKQGWADAGVCVRLVSDEAGLDFFSVQREAYDLCLAGDYRRDPKLQAIVAAVRSTGYRNTLAELPGYDTATSGEIAMVN